MICSVTSFDILLESKFKGVAIVSYSFGLTLNAIVQFNVIEVI